MTELKQIVLGATLFALGTIVCLSLVQCTRNNGEDVIWLIPEGHLGFLVVIENRKDGSPIEYEEDARVYEFPRSGILKTQYKENRGWKKEHFFYVDENGDRTKLLMRTPKNMEAIPEGGPYLTEGVTSFSTPFPYPRFFSRAILRKGFEEEKKKIDLSELLLDYAKKNNDI